jgi:hypothetical protein
MTRLPARSAPTRESSPAFALPTGEPVRRGWLGRGRGILLAERELPFEIDDLLRLFRDLFTQALVLASQSLDLLSQLFPSITKPLDSSRIASCAPASSARAYDITAKGTSTKCVPTVVRPELLLTFIEVPQAVRRKILALQRAN